MPAASLPMREIMSKSMRGLTGFKLQLARDTNIAVLHGLPLDRQLWRGLLLGELPDNARAIGLARGAT
jgi:hypothetical protein